MPLLGLGFTSRVSIRLVFRIRPFGGGAPIREKVVLARGPNVVMMNNRFLLYEMGLVTMWPGGTLFFWFFTSTGLRGCNVVLGDAEYLTRNCSKNAWKKHRYVGMNGYVFRLRWVTSPLKSACWYFTIERLSIPENNSFSENRIQLLNSHISKSTYFIFFFGENYLIEWNTEKTFGSNYDQVTSCPRKQLTFLSMPHWWLFEGSPFVLQNEELLLPILQPPSVNEASRSKSG